MNLRAALDGEAFDIEVRREADGAFCLCIGKERFHVEVCEPEPGILSLLVGDGSYEAVVRRVDDVWWVTLAGRCYPVETTDPAATLVRGPAAVSGAQVVRSVMAGKILEVLVSEGDRVAAGKPLLVIEAMKMENEIRSPKDGTVSTITVQRGQAVEVGADLLVVE